MSSATTWLSEHTNLYTPTPAQFDSARSHRSAIQARLDLYLGISEMFEIGSLKHGTGVWQYSDADYLVSLKGFQPTSPWTMLGKVKEQLQLRFPSTEIVIRRPAVVCKFASGHVEIVPGYPTQNGGYWISDPASDGWMLTHPKQHNAYVTNINTQHNGAAKKLARQLKTWKYKRNVPISSCYLEMRAAKHMDEQDAYLPLWDLYLVLKKIHDIELASMNDPTGLGSRFGAYSSQYNKEDAMSKLSRAVDRARKAKDYEDEGRHDQAIEQLKLLFNR